MKKCAQEKQQTMKLLATTVFFRNANNGGICQFVEKGNINQQSKQFGKGSFNPETHEITIKFNEVDENKVISLPENYGFEIVFAEDNPVYKGYQRICVWDYNNTYIFDAKF